LYVEPFAGGAGAALRLLLEEHVDAILLNDIDPGVAAFWRSILRNNAEFVDLVMTCDLSIEEWERQRRIYETGSPDDLELGFATFYLNRTNRSGILNARPIGGLAQTGQWLINARFNRPGLAQRIRDIGRFRNRIQVSSIDGVDLVEDLLTDQSEAVFLYADPPYLEKSADLYMDRLEWEDHLRLADVLNESGACWIVSYDCDERVHTTLYPDRRFARFAIKHTAATQHVGSEYAVFSDRIMVDDLTGLSTGAAVVFD